MPACSILRLVRSSRCDSVASETRNARAISAVLRPATVRRVRATRLSSAIAGWQQVNSSRSRSSENGSSSGRGPLRHQRRLLQLGPFGGASAQHVEGAVAGHRGEPGRRVAGQAVGRPPRQRRLDRVLHAVLGQVPVAGDPDQAGDQPGLLVGDDRGDRVGRLGRSLTVAQSSTQNGRSSSLPPLACGCRDAISMASSRSSHSRMSKPAIHSLRLGERAVGDQHLALAHPDGGRVVDAAEPVADHALPAAVDVLHPLLDGQLLRRTARPRPPRRGRRRRTSGTSSALLW